MTKHSKKKNKEPSTRPKQCNNQSSATKIDGQGTTEKKILPIPDA